EDPFSDPNAMDQPNEHFEWNMGYSRPNDADEMPAVRMGARPKKPTAHPDRLTLPVQMGQVVYMRLHDGTPVPYRIVTSETKDLTFGGGLQLKTCVKIEPVEPVHANSGAGWYPVDTLWARPPGRSAQRYEVDLAQFLPAMAEAAARGGLPYEPL